MQWLIRDSSQPSPNHYRYPDTADNALESRCPQSQHSCSGYQNRRLSCAGILVITVERADRMNIQ